MFTAYTYQDWERTPEWQRPELMEKIIAAYKVSAEFTHALDALAYFQGENPSVAKKTVLRARKIECKDASGRKRVRAGTEDVVGNRIGSGVFFRLVTQQNQYLLANGVTLKDTTLKERLGLGFDKAMEQIGERALLGGVSWGFWNVDHLETIEAVKDASSGFVALLDEETSAPMVGVQFWQISAKRPLHVRLFELDGLTVYRRGKEEMEVIVTKRPYAISVARDAAGEMITGASNYGALPVIPLYANTEKRSELTPAIRAKIDAYDNILSDFADNLDRANDVYWVLNNFGGTTEDIAVMLEEISRIKAVANLSDGTGAGSTAEPHTIEVPYAARQTALQILEREIYKDYMGVNMDEITGNSLTNVAIRTATANLNLKADRYEWQVFRFVQLVLALQGIKTEGISFKRQTIANETEIIENISVMREDIDDETALKLNPYIDQEAIPGILANRDAKVLTGFSSSAAADRARRGSDEQGDP